MTISRINTLYFAILTFISSLVLRSVFNIVSQNRGEIIIQDSNWFWVYTHITLIFLAPLMEEFAFRYWIAGKNKFLNILSLFNLFFSTSLAFSYSISFFNFSLYRAIKNFILYDNLISKYISPKIFGFLHTYIVLMLISLCLTIPAYLILRKFNIKLELNKNKLLIIFLTSVIFSLTHLQPEHNLKGQVDFIGFLLLNSLCISFIRTKTNFWTAVFMHTLWNSLYMLISELKIDGYNSKLLFYFISAMVFFISCVGISLNLAQIPKKFNAVVMRRF